MRLPAPAAPPPLRLTPAERALAARLRTPLQVQRWLHGLPYNWERRGETARTFRGVVRTGTAHCLEAALSAATLLEQRGFPPLLLDLCSQDALDHVLLLFQVEGRYGTVARSRCPGLHGRAPVFRSVRDLVASYAAPYIDATGRITGYGVLDLREFPGKDWRLGRGHQFWVEDALNDNDHRSYRTPAAFYRRWRGFYDRWAAAHGHPEHGWPTGGYPGQRHWWWP